MAKLRRGVLHSAPRPTDLCQVCSVRIDPTVFISRTLRNPGRRYHKCYLGHFVGFRLDLPSVNHPLPSPASTLSSPPHPPPFLASPSHLTGKAQAIRCSAPGCYKQGNKSGCPFLMCNTCCPGPCSRPTHRREAQPSSPPFSSTPSTSSVSAEFTSPGSSSTLPSVSGSDVFAAPDSPPAEEGRPASTPLTGREVVLYEPPVFHAYVYTSTDFSPVHIKLPLDLTGSTTHLGTTFALSDVKGARGLHLQNNKTGYQHFSVLYTTWEDSPFNKRYFVWDGAVLIFRAGSAISRDAHGYPLDIIYQKFDEIMARAVAAREDFGARFQAWRNLELSGQNNAAGPSSHKRSRPSDDDIAELPAAKRIHIETPRPASAPSVHYPGEAGPSTRKRAAQDVLSPPAKRARSSAVFDSRSSAVIDLTETDDEDNATIDLTLSDDE